MMRTPSIPPTETAPARSAWGFTRGDDGRAVLTHDGQIVATRACRTPAEQARVYDLYSALVRRGASR